MIEQIWSLLGKNLSHNQPLIRGQTIYDNQGHLAGSVSAVCYARRCEIAASLNAPMGATRYGVFRM